MKVAWICGIAAILVGATAFADDTTTTTMRLVCTFSHSVDSKGSSPTSGKKLLTVTYLKDGKAVIKKEGVEALFTGHVSEDTISGATEYQMPSGEGAEPLNIRERISVSRFTGEFQMTFELVGRADSLIHFGTCKPVAAPLF
jgi:hypothetical protein